MTHVNGVLVTRPTAFAAPLVAQLTAMGLQVWQLPTLSIHSLADSPAVQKTLIHLNDYTWHIFVSRNAVQIALPLIVSSRSELDLIHKHWAAVGPGTAAELARFIHTDIIYPQTDFGGAALLACLEDKLDPSDRVLIWCGDAATPTLAQGLQARNIAVESLVCYRREKTVIDSSAVNAALQAGKITDVLVSSGTSLTYLMALLNSAALQHCTLIVISVRLRDLARSLGFTGTIILAPGADDAAMVRVIKDKQHGKY